MQSSSNQSSACCQPQRLMQPASAGACVTGPEIQVATEADTAGSDSSYLGLQKATSSSHDGACSSPGGRRLSAPLMSSPSRRRSNVEEPYVFSVAQAAATLAKAADLGDQSGLLYQNDETVLSDDVLLTAGDPSGTAQHLPRLVYVGRPVSPVDTTVHDSVAASTGDPVGAVQPGVTQHGRWAGRSLSLPMYAGPPPSQSSTTSTSSGQVSRTVGAHSSASAAAAKIGFLRLPTLTATSDDTSFPRRRHSVALALASARHLESIAEEGSGGCLLQAKGSIRRHSVQERSSNTAANL